MKVRHGFATVRAVVDHDTVTGIETELFGQSLRRQQEVAKKRLVTGGSFGKADNGLFGNNEQMHRRLRLNVVDGDAVLVLVGDLGGYLAVDDLLKNSLGHDGGIKTQ